MKIKKEDVNLDIIVQNSIIQCVINVYRFDNSVDVNYQNYCSMIVVNIEIYFVVKLLSIIGLWKFGEILGFGSIGKV